MRSRDGRYNGMRNGLSQKAHVNELFEDAEYKAIAKRRSIECETVFGQIKRNHHTPVQSTGVWCSHKVVAVGFNTFYYGANEFIGNECGD